LCRFQFVELFLQILDLRLVLLLEISHLGLVLLFHCSDFALQLFDQISHIRRSLGYRRHRQSSAGNGDHSGDCAQMSDALLPPRHCPPQGRRPGSIRRSRPVRNIAFRPSALSIPKRAEPASKTWTPADGSGSPAGGTPTMIWGPP
jgi:hypothetical protein